MKRLLSIILALALVISMIPATFAAGEVTATPNALEYVFNYGVFGLTYSGTETEYPYTNSVGIALDGYTEYFNKEKSDPWELVDTVELHTKSIRKDGSLYVTHNKNNENLKKLGNNALTLTFTVDKAGAYRVATNTYKAPLATKTNVYFIEKEYADQKGLAFNVAANIQNAMADEKTMYAGYMDSYDINGSPWKAANNITINMETIYLEAKDYYVIFSMDGDNSKLAAAEESGESAVQQHYYYYIRSVALSEQLPKTIEISCDDTFVEAGETTEITSVVYDADEIAIPYKVNYESSDDDIATVDENGVVTGVGNGTATITATVDGTDIKKTVDIKAHKNLELYYDFSCTALGYSGDGQGFGPIATAHMGEYSTLEGAYADSNKWMFCGMRSTYAGGIYKANAQGVYFSLGSTNMRNSNDGVVLKINIPEGETKTYSPKIEYNELPYGGTADFYIVKPTESGVYSEKYILATPKADGTITGLNSSINATSAELKANGAEMKIATITAYPNSVDTYNNITLESGDYWLAIVPTGGSKAPYNNKYHYQIKSLTLTETTEARQESALFEAFNVTEEIYSAAPLASAKVNTFTACLGETKDSSADDVESISVTPGETCTVEAPDTEQGYRFLYWAKGMSTAKKQIVSRTAKYTFVPTVENTFLIAVYEPIDTVSADNKAEFYNGNGQLIETLTADGNAPALPGMAGYGPATGWKLYGTDDIIAGETPVTVSGTKIYVAQYDDLTEEYTVTVTNGTGSGNYKYGDVVTCTPNGEGTFAGWKKDGKFVSTASTYSFRAWETCQVEAVYGIDTSTFTGKKMKIIIDDISAGSESAIMAEFIGMNDAVEKGIAFGTNRIAMTTSGNQFTVVNDEKVGEVYGYAIFKDGTIVYDR